MPPKNIPLKPAPPPSGGTSALPDDIRESIALASLGGVSQQTASLSNLGYANAIGNVNLTQQNAVANQQALNQVSQATLGTSINLVGDLQPMEAVAVAKLDTGNDMASQIADLKAALTGLGSRGRVRPRVPGLIRIKGVTYVTLSSATLPGRLYLTDAYTPYEIVVPGPNVNTGTPFGGKLPNTKQPHLFRQDQTTYIFLPNVSLPAVIRFTDSKRTFSIDKSGIITVS